MLVSLRGRRRRVRSHELIPARAVCERCRRPASVCYCRHISPVETASRIVVLQHPRERDVAIGTARMATLCLPNAELHVGLRWQGSAALASATSDPTRPAVLLYPGDGAIDIARNPPPGPVTLVVVDGTWWQARKVIRENPTLAALPRYSFTPPAPSEYRIRKEPSETCVSTIEALVHVLGVIEGDTERLEQLLVPFRAMIETQIACEQRFHGARVRRKKGPRPRRRRVPEALLSRAADIVCVSGEANAWPSGSVERPHNPEELVHWTACRPSTGERFELVAAPRQALSPMTPVHLALSPRDLELGCSVGILRDRWRAFVRDTDVLCSWGTYATSLFASEGGYLPPTRFDLRQVARVFASRRIGTLDDFLASLGLPTARPLAEGRAGVRLGQLVEVVRFMENAAAQEGLFLGRAS